jgi:hypothetical protein
MNRRNVILLLVVGFGACRTPNKYIPQPDSGRNADTPSADAATDREVLFGGADIAFDEGSSLKPDTRDDSPKPDPAPPTPDAAMGACASGADSCPNGFRCTNSACPTACTSDTDCSSLHYCSKKACVPRCRSSSGNLIANGGFDTDSAGWLLNNAQWVREDANGCPSSGAIKLDGDGSVLSSCIPINRLATYSYGVHMKAETEVAIECGLRIYSDDNCTESLMATLNDQVAINRWESAVDAVQTPSTARTAQLRCTTFNGVTGEFDLAFLKPGVVEEF